MVLVVLRGKAQMVAVFIIVAVGLTFAVPSARDSGTIL